MRLQDRFPAGRTYNRAHWRSVAARHAHREETTVEDLRFLADKMGVPVPAHALKRELIDAVTGAEPVNEAAPAAEPTTEE